jgi:hypothetical protein
VYIIRRAISGTGLDVHWGQLITKEGYCSPECDIIIHEPGYVARWNGNDEKPVMDFVFVDCRKAVAVVSCKSSVTDIDEPYAEEIRKHVRNVLLFGECCHPASEKRLRRQAKEAGYKGFWHLYVFNKETGYRDANEKVWIDFLRVLKRVAEKAEAARRATRPARRLKVKKRAMSA